MKLFVKNHWTGQFICCEIVKALETITNSDSFYFQLYPLSLYIVNPQCDLPAPGTTYRLTLLKGKNNDYYRPAAEVR